MKEWIYTLKIGKQLRSAIYDENTENILSILIEAWKEIHNQFPDIYDEYDLECDIEDIEIVKENDDVDYEDIDYLLSQLYDYCDGIGIWIDV